MTKTSSPKMLNATTRKYLNDVVQKYSYVEDAITGMKLDTKYELVNISTDASQDATSGAFEWSFLSADMSRDLIKKTFVEGTLMRLEGREGLVEDVKEYYILGVILILTSGYLSDSKIMDQKGKLTICTINMGVDRHQILR